MCLEKYLNRLKGDFNYVLINIEIEGMMRENGNLNSNLPLFGIRK